MVSGILSTHLPWGLLTKAAKTIMGALAAAGSQRARIMMAAQQRVSHWL